MNKILTKLLSYLGMLILWAGITLLIGGIVGLLLFGFEHLVKLLL